MKKSRPFSELRYGCIILEFAPDPNVLLLHKAELIFNSVYRYPELLEIYFEGSEPWVFDEDFDKKAASKYLAYRVLNPYF